MEMCNCGIFTTNIWIVIGLCVTGTYGMADQCINGPNIVPVCSNVTIPTNQMFIPVNSSIGTGCRCNVTLVQVSDNTRHYSMDVTGLDFNNLACGYQMGIEQRTRVFIISCSDYSSLTGSLRLNEFYRMRFTRDSTPNPPSTAGFCLQVNTKTLGARFNMNCWKINTPTTTTTETPSSSLSLITNTQSGSVSSQHTTRSAADTSTWNSTTTDGPSNEVTDNLIFEKLPVAAIGGGIGGAVLLLIVIIVIVILCRRRHNNDYDKPSDRITESTNYNNLRVKDEMVIIDNDKYKPGTR